MEEAAEGPMDGTPETEGLTESVDVGTRDTLGPVVKPSEGAEENEGGAEGAPEGRPETEGFLESLDVGTRDVLGSVVSALEGTADNEGGADGTPEGRRETEGFTESPDVGARDALGPAVNALEGTADREGGIDGVEDGFSDMVGACQGTYRTQRNHQGRGLIKCDAFHTKLISTHSRRVRVGRPRFLIYGATIRRSCRCLGFSGAQSRETRRRQRQAGGRGRTMGGRSGRCVGGVGV